MTGLLFREDAYRREAPAVVENLTPEGGIVLDHSLFYPTGGGQPGDSGWIIWDGNHLPIATTVKAQGDAIALVPAEAAQLPPIGARVTQKLDWDRRHKHMRVHTALHLLSVVIPFGVTVSTTASRTRIATAMSLGCVAMQESEVPMTPSCRLKAPSVSAAQPDPGARLLHGMLVS